MKIAICINTSWNIYNFRKGLINYFLSRGDEVLAIAPRDEYSEKLIQMGCLFEEVSMSASGLNPVDDFKIIRNLRNILKKHEPEVYLSYTIKPNIYGAIACGTLGIPAISNVSGLGTVFLLKGYVRKIATQLYSFGFKFSNWIFFQNEDDQQEFAHFVQVNLNKTSLLPGSGINLDNYQPSKAPQNSEPVFLMLARLIVEKGLNEYADAIRIVKNQGGKARFILLGGHDESHSRAIPKANLDQWIEEGLIEYGGHVDNVQEWIEKADVVVLPSYREGTPRTLLEAAAMGKPLIATDVPGCNSVVRDGYNGFLCELKNHEDLANRMISMLSMTEQERYDLGKNSRKLVEEVFDEQIVIELYSSKIDELTRKQHSSSK